MTNVKNFYTTIIHNFFPYIYNAISYQLSYETNSFFSYFLYVGVTLKADILCYTNTVVY
jgi:hypothetical protein